MEPYVFVIMAVYRAHHQFLAAQITSILHQSHKNFELVVVPDGPDNDLESKLAQFNDPRIHVYPQSERLGIRQNFLRGLSIALNRSHTDTDLFAYCDQDDVWIEDKLSSQCAQMAQRDVTMCYSDLSVINEEGEVIHQSVFQLEGRSPHRCLNELLLVNDVSGATMMFNKTVARIASCGLAGQQEKVLHDWWTALIASAIGRAVFISVPLVHYRLHSSNVIGPALSNHNRTSRQKSRFMSNSYAIMCAQQLQTRQYVIEQLSGRCTLKKHKIFQLDNKKNCLNKIPTQLLLTCRLIIWRASGRTMLSAHAFRALVGSITRRSTNSHDRDIKVSDVVNNSSEQR